jgi:hypothetical protein
MASLRKKSSPDVEIASAGNADPVATNVDAAPPPAPAPAPAPESVNTTGRPGPACAEEADRCNAGGLGRSESVSATALRGPR